MAPSPTVTEAGDGTRGGVAIEGRVWLAQLGCSEDGTVKAVGSLWRSRRNQYCRLYRVCPYFQETFVTIQSWTLELQVCQTSLTPLSQPPDPNSIPKDFPRGHESEDAGNGDDKFIPSSGAGFSLRMD